jgi:hypothetical protein
MIPQAKMRGFDRSYPSVDAFAKIEIRLTPGKISMISLDQDSLSVGNRDSLID